MLRRLKKKLVKVAWKTLEVSGWIYIGSSILLLIGMFTSKAYEVLPIIVLAGPLGVVFVISGKRGLNRNKQTNISIVTAQRKTTPIHATITTSAPPKETLRGMKAAYTKLQFQRDKQILEESIIILSKTTNFQTFFSRADLALRIVLTMRQAELAKVRGLKNTQQLVDSVFNLVDAMKVRILEDAYRTELESANKLKTEKGKLARMQRFYETLLQYRDEFESTDEYEDVLSRLQASQYQGIAERLQ